MKIDRKLYSLDLSMGDGHSFDYMEQKGFFKNAILEYETKEFLLNIYDSVRVCQDIAYHFEISEDVFFEPNMLVVKTLTIDEICSAIDDLIKNSRLSRLVSNN